MKVVKSASAAKNADNEWDNEKMKSEECLSSQNRD